MIHLSKLGSVKTFALRVFSWGNLVALVTILIGVLASLGLLDKFTTREGVMLGVLTLPRYADIRRSSSASCLIFALTCWGNADSKWS